MNKTDCNPDITGEWVGHINNIPTKFKFDNAVLCGFVGKYRLISSDNWVTIKEIKYINSYLVLETEHGICNGYVATNMVSGQCIVPNTVKETSIGHCMNGNGGFPNQGSWSMYK
jgi:hypothetical protein